MEGVGVEATYEQGKSLRILADPARRLKVESDSLLEGDPLYTGFCLEPGDVFPETVLLFSPL
jgi:hypothetical protein